MTHPLLDAGMELDCALRTLLGAGYSPRRRQRVLEAASVIRAELLDLTRSDEQRPATIDDVRRVLESARRNHVPWHDIVAVVNHLQGDA